MKLKTDCITFICPDCGRREDISRCETDHPTAKVCQLQCPDCDDGDFHEPRWQDAKGRDLEDSP